MFKSEPGPQLLKMFAIIITIIMGLDRDTKIIVSQDRKEHDWLQGCDATPRPLPRWPDNLNQTVTANNPSLSNMTTGEGEVARHSENQ